MSDASSPRFRKVQRQNVKEKAAISSQLREARDQIGLRNFSDALSKLNNLAGLFSDNLDKSKILGLVGDSELSRGDAASAKQVYAQAVQLSADDELEWLRPALAEIRASLLAGQVQDAVTFAAGIWEKSKAQQEKVKQRREEAKKLLKAGTAVVIIKRPPRASVVGSRLGRMFFDQGELETAKAYFQLAISVNPEGACRARQGLAAIALRNDALAEAEQHALDALRVGRLQAKTVSAWALLLSARQRQGKKGLDPQLVEKLNLSNPLVRSRAWNEIARKLRDAGDPSWEQYASDWLARDGASHPAFATEIHKMLLASGKRTGVSREKRVVLANRLLAQPDIGPQEWISAAKESVQSALTLNKTVDLDGLLQASEAKFSKAHRNQASHSLALSCMMAQRHDLARPLLENLMAKLPVGKENWAKAVWSLARMEEFLGNHARAAALYQNYRSQGQIAPPFRLQAGLLWAKSILASNSLASFDNLKAEIRSVLAPVQDSDTLLNFARQLRFASPQVSSLAGEVFARGMTLAEHELADTTEPSLYRQRLFRMSRRQVVDFQNYEDAVSRWENFSADKQTWLWSEEGVFWSYLSLVLTSYLNQNLEYQGEAFAHRWLEDPATPPVGVAEIGTNFAVWKIKNNRVSEAMTDFAWLVGQAPVQPACAAAYYWLSLAQWESGKTQVASALAQRVRDALGNSPSTLANWELDAKALLIQFDLNPVPVQDAQPNYDANFLQTMINEIHANLKVLA